MRFHIGFSKRISWKWLLLIGGGLLAFFGVGNHFALAATLSADATGVYVVSPMYDVQSPAVEAGDLLNQQSATTYNITWSSQRYSAFQTTTIGSSKYLAYGSDLLKARLRWTYATSDMNKCSSSQAIQYEFQFYLRDVSGSIPNTEKNGTSSRWNYPHLFSRVWIRSSQTNYDCEILSRESNVMRVRCTIPNPTAAVYMYLEDFTAFYPIAAQGTLFNVGLAPIQYTCTGIDSAGIINSVNSSAQSIIENNNNNTNELKESFENSMQEIVDSSSQNTDAIIGSVMDDTTYNASDVPSFIVENMAISSQSQKLFMLPIQMLNAVVSGADTCTPLTINLSSLNGLLHSNIAPITIPCMGTRIKNYIGENWYTTFDFLMSAIVFYYIASNIVIRIQQVFSGVDTLPSYYTSHGKTKTMLVDNTTGEVVG